MAASRKKNNINALNPGEPPKKSAVWQAIEAHKLKGTGEDGTFAIALPDSESEVKCLRFRNYRSVMESDEAASQAAVFAETFVAKQVRLNPELAEFSDMEKSTIMEAWLLGFLCVEDDGTAHSFLNMARWTPMLFKHVRVAVDEACFGNEAVLFSEGMNAAKKD